MKALAIAFPLFIIAMTMLTITMASMNEKRQKQSRLALREREAQMDRWLDARPTEMYRQQAYEILANALAVGVIRDDEHSELIRLVMNADLNSEVQDVISEVEIVERPE